MTLTKSREGLRDITADESGAVAGASIVVHPIGPTPAPHPVHGPAPIDPHPLPIDPTPPPINPGGPIVFYPL